MEIFSPDLSFDFSGGDCRFFCLQYIFFNLCPQEILFSSHRWWEYVTDGIFRKRGEEAAREMIYETDRL